jgi:hypothetical protein
VFSPQEDNVAFTIPVLPALRAAIEDMPKSKRYLTFLVTEYGKPYPANGLQYSRAVAHGR